MHPTNLGYCRARLQQVRDGWAVLAAGAEWVGCACSRYGMGGLCLQQVRNGSAVLAAGAGWVGCFSYSFSSFLLFSLPKGKRLDMTTI